MDHEERKGQRFKVVEQCTAVNRDLCTLPMWKIQFPDGKVIDAYPEEIIPNEMHANGCNLFDDKTVAVEALIHAA